MEGPESVNLLGVGGRSYERNIGQESKLMKIDLLTFPRPLLQELGNTETKVINPQGFNKEYMY